MPILPMINDNAPVEENKDTFRGYCVVGMETNLNDEWPTEFCVVPGQGDFVRSKGGATLKILKVTHMDGPTFELLLGKDTTTQDEVGF